FVVHVAGTEVVAVGTVFAVRSSVDALAVTLIEGRVTVRPSADAGGVAPAAPLTMNAGERVRLKASGSPSSAQVDRPNIEQVVAWKRSEVVFDDVALVDAVAE